MTTKATKATKLPTILEALDDPRLLGAVFAERESWGAWRTFLAALFGLPLPREEDVYTFHRHTGRQWYMPGKPAREAYVVAGRRAGKSRIAATVAVYLACFRDYRKHLAPGERATISVIAADRRQARVVLNYIRGAFENVPLLKRLVVADRSEALELRGRVVIEVHTASFRAVRGYTIAAAILDEVAFWRTDEWSANPDQEIVAALRPAMLTIPGSLLLAISSPYARRGVLWEAYRQHWEQPESPVLVWRGSTLELNPTVPEKLIAEAFAADPNKAASEYGAEFRYDIEAFLSRDAIEAVVDSGRRERVPQADVQYVAFVDPSGGSQDAMALAVAHREYRDGADVAVLDCLRRWKAPFNPEAVVAECAEVLARYGVRRVVGDAYAGEWPRTMFRRRGILYDVAELTRTQIYAELEPLVNTGRVLLLDDEVLVRELVNLERRRSRGGRNVIDHPPGGHDDVANAAAGALVLACARATRDCGIFV